VAGALLEADATWTPATRHVLDAVTGGGKVLALPAMSARHLHRIYRRRLERLARLGIEMELWHECLEHLGAAAAGGELVRLFAYEGDETGAYVFTHDSGASIVGAFSKPSGEHLRLLLPGPRDGERRRPDR
jgi:hypothetical protein